MSIRKVSDLETLDLVGGTAQLSDIDESLLELSFPDHSSSGHAFKSMKARYGDMRKDLLSSVFNTQTSVYFTTSAMFENSVQMLCGLQLSGLAVAEGSDIRVNADDPDWADRTVYVRAGDMTFYGQSDVTLKSDNRITLSAKNLYAYSDSIDVKSFDGDRSVAQLTKTGAKVCVPLEVPTAVSSDSVSTAVNVERLGDEISSVKDWVDARIQADSDESFTLMQTKLYTNDDIQNVEYLLAKTYKHTYIKEIEKSEGGIEEQQIAETFIEYDIKSRPTSYDDPDNKQLYFPDLLDNDGMSILVTETNNMTSPKKSSVRQTSVSLIPLGTDGDLANYILGVKLDSVDKNESANIHVFARVTDFKGCDDKSHAIVERIILPQNPRIETNLWFNFNNPDYPELSAPRYTFSTPQFKTYEHGKFLFRVQGRLGIESPTSKLDVIMYAAFTDIDNDDNICLYSGMYQPRAVTNVYPLHERMHPQWKAGVNGQPAIIPETGLVVGYDKKKKDIVKYIRDADNGYPCKTNKAYDERNNTTYSYVSRYRYMYTTNSKSHSASYNTALADDYTGPGGSVLETKLNKSISHDNKYFINLGTEKVKNGGSFQFSKVFTLDGKSYDGNGKQKARKKIAKSMRIVFGVAGNTTNNRIFMMNNNDAGFKVQVVYLD